MRRHPIFPARIGTAQSISAHSEYESLSDRALHVVIRTSLSLNDIKVQFWLEHKGYFVFRPSVCLARSIIRRVSVAASAR